MNSTIKDTLILKHDVKYCHLECKVASSDKYYTMNYLPDEGIVFIKSGSNILHSNFNIQKRPVKSHKEAVELMQRIVDKKLTANRKYTLIEQA